jgi:hypothetical protein
MVKLLDPKDCINIIEHYFNVNFKDFKLMKSTSYAGYWWLEYANKEGSSIYFDGDTGGHFYIKINIDKTEYNLWQYDRSVNQYSKSTKGNILYQLNVLKEFFE